MRGQRRWSAIGKRGTSLRAGRGGGHFPFFVNSVPHARAHPLCRDNLEQRAQGCVKSNNKGTRAKEQGELVGWPPGRVLRRELLNLGSVFVVASSPSLYLRVPPPPSLKATSRAKMYARMLNAVALKGSVVHRARGLATAVTYDSFGQPANVLKYVVCRCCTAIVCFQY
jgi:hypothetical protein